MTADERALESQVSKLGKRGRRAQAAGRPVEAAAAYRLALEAAAELMRRQPEDLRHVQASASLHYDLAGLVNSGALLGSGGSVGEAVDALGKALAEYGLLFRDEVPGAYGWMIDVFSRRGLSYTLLGYDASAVLDTNVAVGMYRKLTAAGGGSPLDLGRILAVNARILVASGDAALGAASADEAVRHLAAAGAQNGPGAEYLRLAYDAKQKAADAAGRGGPSLIAALASIQLFAGHPRPTRQSAGELVRQLSTATRNLAGEPPVCPAERCALASMADVAARLAEIAVQVLPAHPTAGIRVALEAHYLFHTARLETDFDLGAHGAVWLDALTACRRAYREDGVGAMAEDLAVWMLDLFQLLETADRSDPRSARAIAAAHTELSATG